MENKPVYTISYDSVRYTVIVRDLTFHFSNVDSVLDFLNSNRYSFVRSPRKKLDIDIDKEISSIDSFLKENYKNIKNHNNR